MAGVETIKTLTNETHPPHVRGLGSRLMLRPKVRAAVLLYVAAVLCAACSLFDDCESDRIEVSNPVSVLWDNVDETWDLTGRVYVTNLDPPSYAALVDALIDGTRSTAGAVWTIDQGFGTQGGWMAVTLGGSVTAGEVLQVGDIFTGGGWGVSSPSALPAQVGVHVGTFEATSVSGTITVLTEAPLSLRLDLEFGDGSGSTLSIEGDMTFQRVRESVSCD